MPHQRFLPFVLSAITTILCAATCMAPETSVTPESMLDSLDLASFTQLPGMPQVDSGEVSLRLQPDARYDHWQLRRFQNGAVVILAQGGRLSVNELPAEFAAAVEWTPDKAGFGSHCLPARCFKYIVTAGGDGVATLLSVDQLRPFLGDINTPDEAALLAEASGYHWGGSKEDAAIREVADGYQLLVLQQQQTSDCPLSDVYRVLLHVSRSAALTEERSELIEQMCGVF